MAKEEPKVAAAEPKQAETVQEVAYARFHMPVQFIGAVDGVHSDTSKLSGAKMTVNQLGIKLEFKKRTILVGWPNLHYVELKS